MDEIEKRVKAVIWEHLQIDQDQVVDGASFVTDLGADSLDTIELVMAMEEEFDIEIKDEEAEKITTVKQAVDYIQLRMKEPKP